MRPFFFVVLAVLACSHPTEAPDPRLSPAEVVRAQLEALADNEGDAGIAATFRFASPANKRITGPLERFVGIVRAPAYRPLLNHRRAELGAVEVREDRAIQLVRIVAKDGSEHRFLFELSRQIGGRFDGCWMTDSVYALEGDDEAGVAV